MYLTKYRMYCYFYCIILYQTVALYHLIHAAVSLCPVENSGYPVENSVEKPVENSCVDLCALYQMYLTFYSMLAKSTIT